MTILSKLANHQIRHQATQKSAVCLVVAYGHFNPPRACVGTYGLTYSLLSPLRAAELRMNKINQLLLFALPDPCDE